MSDSAEWLRNLARNYADGVPGMTPQDHHAWQIADEIERLQYALVLRNEQINRLKHERDDWARKAQAPTVAVEQKGTQT